MTSSGAPAVGRAAETPDACELWAWLCELVLDNQRRREASEAVGLSFGRIRAIRRIARQPMSMGELATALGIDPPNATTLVDDLEDLGLAQRQPHPLDRRAKVVSATRKGAAAARRADQVLSVPPPGLSGLPDRDLEELHRILGRVRTGQ